MSDRTEGEMMELVDTICRDLTQGRWDDLSPFSKYQIKDQVLPVITACIAAVDAEPHKPKRGDEVDAWIKRLRDERTDEEEWTMIDVLLDDYRLHADTGTPLSSDADEMGG